MRFFRGVRARPGIAAVAADHRAGEAGLDRHGRQRHRQDLARAAIVERGGKARVDAEPLADVLVMAVRIRRGRGR